MNTHLSELLGSAGEESRKYAQYRLDVADRLHAALKEKGWTQKEFAARLGKKESLVSRWLSGQHNFTLRTLAEISAVLERDVLCAPAEAAPVAEKPLRPRVGKARPAGLLVRLRETLSAGLYV